MKQAELITSKNGSRCLIVYYSMALNNYDEAIAEGERQFNPEGEPLAVIAYPDHRRVETGERMGNEACIAKKNSKMVHT